MLQNSVLIGAFLFENYFLFVVYTSALISLIVFCIYIFFIDEKNNVSNVKDLTNHSNAYNLSDVLSSYAQVLKNKKYTTFLCCTFCLIILRFQFPNYISIRIANTISEANFFSLIPISGVELTGILRAENTLLTIIIIFFVNRIISNNDMKDFSRCYIGILFFALGYFFLAQGEGFYILFSAVLILTLGEILFAPTSQVIMARMFPEHSRSKYLSVFHLQTRLGNILSSFGIMAGSVFSPLVMSYVFLCIGLLGIVFFRSTERGFLLKSQDQWNENVR